MALPPFDGLSTQPATGSVGTDKHELKQDCGPSWRRRVGWSRVRGVFPWRVQPGDRWLAHATAQVRPGHASTPCRHRAHVVGGGCRPDRGPTPLRPSIQLRAVPPDVGLPSLSQILRARAPCQVDRCGPPTDSGTHDLSARRCSPRQTEAAIPLADRNDPTALAGQELASVSAIVCSVPSTAVAAYACSPTRPTPTRGDDQLGGEDPVDHPVQLAGWCRRGGGRPRPPAGHGRTPSTAA